MGRRPEFGFAWVLGIITFACARSVAATPAPSLDEQVARVQDYLLRPDGQFGGFQPPGHVSPAIRARWRELSYRDQFAHISHPNLQKHFPEGKIDWSPNSPKLKEYHLSRMERNPDPFVQGATRVMRHASDRFVEYAREQTLREIEARYKPELVKRAEEKVRDVKRPFHVPKLALLAVGRDIGQLTGVPGSRLNVAWKAYADGLEDTVEAAYRKDVKASVSGRYASAFDELSGAVFQDMETVASAWQTDLNEAAAALDQPAAAGPAESRDPLELELAGIEDAANAAADAVRSEYREKTEAARATLRRTGESVADLRAELGQLTSEAAREAARTTVAMAQTSLSSVLESLKVESEVRADLAKQNAANAQAFADEQARISRLRQDDLRQQQQQAAERRAEFEKAQQERLRKQIEDAKRAAGGRLLVTLRLQYMDQLIRKWITTAEVYYAKDAAEAKAKAMNYLKDYRQARIIELRMEPARGY